MDALVSVFVIYRTAFHHQLEVVHR